MELQNLGLGPPTAAATTGKARAPPRPPFTASQRPNQGKQLAGHRASCGTEKIDKGQRKDMKAKQQDTAHISRCQGSEEEPMRAAGRQLGVEEKPG